MYEGQKPVNWCLDCRSALAEAEVEHEDKISSAIDVGFEVQDIQAVGKIFGVSLAKNAQVYAVIWTTTPWTLPANQAVCVHPELRYDLIKTEKGYLILAFDLASVCLSRYQLAGSNDRGNGIAASCDGAALQGLLLQHPFCQRTVPVICGEHVTLEAGTGLVHTAPAHGLDDYVVGQKYSLSTHNPVADDGKFIASTELVSGLFVWKANDVVVDALKNSGHLLQLEKIKHSYPHCWRHKTPIIFRATPQWFIGMDRPVGNNALPGTHLANVQFYGVDTLRERANTAVSVTQFYPVWGRARLEAMIKNRPDWCVSRQRSWGVPMPFFVDKEWGRLHPDTPALLERVAKLVEQQGIEAWFSLDIAEFMGADAAQYKKLTHTLDVWFDSGTTHASVLRHNAELKFPADLYLEGSDQHRGWFQSSLLTSCAINGRAPYDALLTHGFVVDGHGHKMSKSKGNVIAPQKILDTLGADILRLWVASTDYSGEMTISDEILKRVVESYRRIRNTLRFLLANTADFDAQRDAIPVVDWLEIDRYALARMAQLQNEVQQDYTDYQFHLVVQKLQTFCSEYLGGFYLDVLKDRLYTAGAHSIARRSAQNALHHIAHSLVRLIAPILSFTAEEAWQVLCGKEDESVFVGEWHSLPDAGLDSTEIQDWLNIEAWRAKVNKHIEEVRVAGLIGQALAAEVDIYAAGENFKLLTRLGDDLRYVMITSRATVHAIASAAEQKIVVIPSTHDKCERCWHYRADVGRDVQHATICRRCVDTLSNASMGENEQRRYA